MSSPLALQQQSNHGGPTLEFVAEAFRWQRDNDGAAPRVLPPLKLDAVLRPCPRESVVTAADLKRIDRYLALKRAIDVVGAIAGLLAFLPAMMVAAILIRLTSPGPVFFTQRRTGRDGKVFRVYKLRTMTDGADRTKCRLLAFSEQDGPAFKMEDDPRVTRVGRFLRKSSLDEAPQFLNVLLGDMSLVGPRPLPVEEAQQLSERDRQRELVKPGVTCLWQINGRNTVHFAEWMSMDRRYIRKCSLRTDIDVLLQTLRVPISMTGR